MTTTNLYSGYDPSGKPSSRVLNPPGGRSNNIFGGDPDEAPRQRVEQQAPPKEALDQNQNAGATSSPAQQNKPVETEKKKDGGAAPFASFEESGKPSNPTQFDKCDSGSQNDADFRCYSVTAYRDAIQQNAAVRQKGRGQASTGFNPITHEEVIPSPFSDYEQARNHHQKLQSTPAQQRNGKLQQQNQNKVQYNPITGEEIPATHVKQKKAEDKPDEEEESKDENTDKETKENTTSNATSTDASEPAKKPNNPSIKVRQPPGGKSSGLW